MKKILLGICAVACLATAGFSEVVKLSDQEMKLDKKLDKNFCKAYISKFIEKWEKEMTYSFW